MRIVLTPFGSRGDVQPLLALGLGLRAHGHEVLFATGPNYQGWIESLGLPFHPVGYDFESWLRQQGPVVHSQLASLWALGRYAREELPVSFAQMCEALRGADLAVTGIHPTTRSAAELLGVPCRTLGFTAQILPSRHHPPLSVPWQGLPGWLNRGLWHAMHSAFNLLFKSALNRERMRRGLPPLSSFLEHARGRDMVIAADPQLASLPPDAPPGAVQTGALRLPVEGALEPELEAFLQAGEPPVYIGFGSMPDESPQATSRLIAEGVRLAGRRAILCAGWAGLGETGLPEGILAIREAPHALLFPRVAVVVHHGGAGTTAAALHAGVPQVMVPHSADQFFHGHRVRVLGLGAAPIARPRLTAKALGQALRQVLSTPAMAERARALAEQLSATDGVAATVQALLPQAASPGTRAASA